MEVFLDGACLSFMLLTVSAEFVLDALRSAEKVAWPPCRTYARYYLSDPVLSFSHSEMTYSELP